MTSCRSSGGPALLRVAIVGLGPWGLCALERLLSAVRSGARANPGLVVHLIEPGPPGSGIYDVAQPDYLLLNNACDELSLYPFEDEARQPRYGKGFYDWLDAQRCCWDPDECSATGGRPVQPDDFVARRLMGEYLQWFYRELVADVPAGVELVHHATLGVDLVPRRDGTEELRLADGRTVLADHVILTLGHVPNAEPRESPYRPAHVAPYPVDPYADSLGDGATVAVAGMGLVAVDVVFALTAGRGGQFVGNGGALAYRPSGREPTIHLLSRSGLPYTSKPPTRPALAPVVRTPEALAGVSRSPSIDFRREVLPLLGREMSARYYAQAAAQAGVAPDAATAAEQLRTAHSEGRFEHELDRLAARLGPFDPEAMFFGRAPAHESPDDYERFAYDAIAADMREAQAPNGGSPVKAAAEVFRSFRDPIRSIVEYGRLSLEGYLDFRGEIGTRISRLVAGPPASRMRQLLALMDAGVVRLRHGPAPALRRSVKNRGRIRVSSTLIAKPVVDDVDLLIRGYLEDPRIDASTSALLTRLYRRGRVNQLWYGAVSVGSIDVTPDTHPVDREGRPQERLWVLGPVTEGTRYFTHYIPSAKRGMRGFEDIGACVKAILS